MGDTPFDLSTVIAESDTADAIRRLTQGDHDPFDTADEVLDVATRVLQSDPVLAERALSLADGLTAGLARCRSLRVTATSSYLRARLAVNGGLPEDAFGLIDRSKRAWLELGRPLDALRTELGRMHVLDDLGRHGEAASAAEELLAELDGLAAAGEGAGADDLDQAEWLRGAALENLGVAYGFTGRYDAALAAYEQAEDLYRRLGDLGDVARCRANRGVELVALGRAADGLRVLDAAGADFLEVGDRLDHAKCLGHAADAELLLGRYGPCLHRCERARVVLDELGARSERCRVDLRTVRAYLSLNLIEEAEGLAGDVDDVLAELGLRHDRVECRWLWALARLRADRHHEAMELLAVAANEAVELDDVPLLGMILLTWSEAAASTGDRPEALDVAGRALALFEGDRWPTEELQLRVHLAELTDGGQAQDHLDRAGDLSRSLGLPHLQYPVLLALGRAARRRGRPVEARSLLEDAVETVEGLRGPLADEALRTSYLEGRTGAHAELIAILLEQGTPEAELAAFDLAERSKARTLADLLAGAVAPPESPSDRALSDDLVDLDAAYSALLAGGSAVTAERRRVVHQRAIEIERRLLVARHRSSVSGGPTQTPSPTPEPGRPGPDTQLIEYHVVDDRIVAFVWSGGQLRVADVDLAVVDVERLVSSWERQVARYLFAPGRAAAATALTGPATSVLLELGALALDPVLPLLDRGQERVTIVPHGPLTAVPFHALVGRAGPAVDHWTITVAPSFEVASHLNRRPWSPRWQRSVVVGVPDAQAPEVEIEARRVAEVLAGSQILLGPDATVDRLRSELVEPCDVLHLACHGLHRSANPMFSALRMHDGWLTAADVLSLELDQTLVVLSACESGRRSTRHGGDEAVGLARSFLAAGASAVIVSLWLTDDEVTAELMDNVYRSLADGQRPAAALRAAQIDLCERHPHPADWAPFVVYGDH